jgi:hypothetical protein
MNRRRKEKGKIDEVSNQSRQSKQQTATQQQQQLL